MPTEIAVIVGAITVIFLLFAAVLAWASHHSKGFRAPGATYF